MQTYLVDASGKVLVNASGVAVGEAVYSSNEKGQVISISGAAAESAVGPGYGELAYGIGVVRDKDDGQVDND